MGQTNVATARKSQDFQEQPRRNQEEPGDARRSHEQPGGARRFQEQPGVARGRLSLAGSTISLAIQLVCCKVSHKLN